MEKLGGAMYRFFIALVFLLSCAGSAYAESCGMDIYILESLRNLKTLGKLAHYVSTEDLAKEFGKPYVDSLLKEIQSRPDYREYFVAGDYGPPLILVNYAPLQESANAFLDSLLKIDLDEQSGFCIDSTKSKMISSNLDQLFKFFHRGHLDLPPLNGEHHRNTLELLKDYIWVKYKGNGGESNRTDITSLKNNWILDDVRTYSQLFPESPFVDFFETLIDQDFVDEIYEKTMSRDVNMRFGIALLGGYALRSSAFDDFDAPITGSFVSGRFQYKRVLGLLQLDVLLGGDDSGVGLDLYTGFVALNRRTFTIDLMAGAGFMEYHVGNDTTFTFYPTVGIQADKYFMSNDLTGIFIRAQWLFKPMNYENPALNRKRRGYVNEFHIGVGFGANQILGDLLELR